MTLRPPIRTFALLATLTSTAGAHELTHTVGRADTVAIRIAHDDGTPFAFVYYELFPAGKEKATQVGRTDAHGRVFFAADDVPQWRLKAFSPDGHGVDLRFDAPPTMPPQAIRETEPSPSRIERLLVGFAMIFVGFGIYRFWSRKKS